MIKEPSENVKLTFEQLQQIDVVQKQLSNIQSEITNANKILKGTKIECDRATKERVYQEELIEGLKETVSILETKKGELIEQVNDAIKTLDETTKKSIEIEHENKIKTDELNKKESSLIKFEEAHNKNVEDFNTKSSQLLEDQLSIKTAKDAFLKATETVIW